MTFSLTIEIFNLRNVLFYLFRNDIGIYSKKIMITTLFLSFAILGTSLVVLILLVGLGLVGRLLFIRYISKEIISGLILLIVFIFFFY